MQDMVLELISKQYPLHEKSIGQYGRFTIKGLQFSVCAFEAQGLGHVSLMKARAPLGLMVMNSLNVVPDRIDVPMFVIDRMKMLHQDVLLIEGENTVLNPSVLQNLAELKKAAASLKEFHPESRWYDSYHIPESIFKQGTRFKPKAFDDLTPRAVAAFLADCAQAAPCDIAEKRKRNAAFVDTLISQGGVSTDLFLKGWGKEKAGSFIRGVVFGTE